MSRTQLTILGLVSAALLAGGGYYAGRLSSVGIDHASSASKAGGKPPMENKGSKGQERRILYWHDPMHPQQKFDKPGKSPFMDMMLQPVYADDDSDEGKVSISSRAMQNLGIRTAEVKQGEMDTGFGTVGAVTIDERTIATVQSRVNGYVERLHVRAQYDPVVAGQPLVDIYAPEWLAAQEEYLALRQGKIAGDKVLFQAARQRLLLLGISEQHIQRMEQEGKASARVTLYAPRAGVVWELGARDGQAVSPGMTLFKLVNLGSMWVYAEIPETQAGQVKPGTPVKGHTATVPPQVFEGQVAALPPEVNPTTRTVKARIVVANPGRLLRPGMFARLDFAGGRTRALMVPSEAVIYTGTRTVVIVAEAGGKFRPVDVEAGRENAAMTEIRKGLNEGDKIVVSGQFLVDSEASLRSTLDRLQGTVQNGPRVSADREGAK